MRVAIIGTAGRREDGQKLNRAIYNKMVRSAITLLNDKHEEFGEQFGNEIHLISGGAAWADHCAVSVYLLDLCDTLTLYLPAEWTGTDFSGTRDGEVANYYHRLFSEKMNGSSLAGIGRAKEKGASLIINRNGFKARNLQVGRVDILIAYTFGEKEDTPKDGGTLHTWNNSSATVKIHKQIQKL